MKLTRKHRLVAALYTLFSLLFMQLAVAAYACQGVPAGQMDGGIASMASMDGQGCQPPDQASGNLCKSHCEKSSQSVDSLPHTMPDAPVLPLLAVTSTFDSHLLAASGLHGDQFATVTDPPPALRFCVLRI